MYCLLCHEKISRLRAWRTKSEFCCDEHAEIYKRQTLERLLTDQEGGEVPEAPPLPVETRRASAESGKTEERTSGASEALARFEELDNRPAAQRLGAGPEAEGPAGSDHDEGLQELWRLADEVGPPAAEAADDDGWSSAKARPAEELPEPVASEFGRLGDGLGSGLGGSLGGLGQGLGGGTGGVRQQSAEEALAALRQLSGGGRHSSEGLDDSSDELDTLLSARGLDTAADDELDLNAIGGSLPGSFDEDLAGEEALLPLDVASLEPLDDDELPSILDRLTERTPEAEELDLGAPAVEELTDGGPLELTDGGPFADLAEALPAEELQEAAPLEELAETPPIEELEEEAQPAAEEIGDELEQAAADAPEKQDASSSEEAAEEIAADNADSEDSGAFDLIEEAVGSHLEEDEEPASQRGWGRKVVPFPLSRSKKPEREEKPAPAASQPAASAGERPRGKGKSAKAGKGMTADLSRLKVKPVAVMFGLEPTLHEPAEDGEDWLPAGVATQSGPDGIVEPAILYPDSGGGRPAGAHLPVYARLFPLLPEVPECEPLQGQAGDGAGPDFALPCVTPPPLALRRNDKAGKPSVGSERAWMFQIEPTLAEGGEFEMQQADGDRHAPWQFPQLPAALLSGVTLANGAGKLNLSGPEGKFAPPVDRLCLIFPELGELGGGVSRQSSSKAPGDEMGRWMPPTVLDPRFDIERPAGRELSDFG